jgi:lipopolysaccharide transport system ATP-binding protein
MSDSVITVENLGKKYRIKHQAERQRYKALRDVLADKTKGVASHLWSLVRGPRSRSPVVQSSRASHEDFWALKDVSFEVKQGEVVGIIGRNGAGKSTLLKILSRITEPTTGRIHLRGRVASLLEVGTGFHPELTGRENIFLNGAILGMSKAEIKRKFDEIVAFSEVEKFLDTPVKRYSSGMYVRLAFAVAAHLEPEILIVDEVLAVGDAEFQRKCLGRMHDVADQGRTVMFVSHNMATMQGLCSEGVLLRHGSVTAKGKIGEVVAQYLRSMEESASQSLEHRSERHGAGDVRLRKVVIAMSEKSSPNMLMVGAPAQFAFRLSDVMPGLACKFTVYDEQGHSVMNFDSQLHGPHDKRVPDQGSLCVCRVEELLLVPGRYRVNVAVFGDGRIQDHVEAAAFFKVEEGTLEGRAVPRGAGTGSVCLPHQWILPEVNRGV